MSDAPKRIEGSSRALQGCLYGAVALFVIMFLGMIYLGYVQFRNNTQTEQNPDGSPSTLSLPTASIPLIYNG